MDTEPRAILRKECPMTTKIKKNSTNKRRPRRVFTSKFMAEVVNQCRVDGNTVASVRRRFDLTGSSVRQRVRKADALAAAASTPATSSTLTPSEQHELNALRRQVKTLKMEREISKKATAFFAKESS